MSSIDGLLYEVSTSAKLGPVLAAGEQALYGDTRIYSQVGPSFGQAVKADKDMGHGKQQQQRGKKESQHEDGGNPVLDAIQTAKHAVQSALSGVAHALAPSDDNVDALRQEIASLKLGQQQLRDEIAELRQLVQKSTGGQATTSTKPAAAAPAKDEAADEDFDLFGSDEEEESEEQKKIREQRLAEYAAKKSKKPGPIAKSSVILDVKPWDDTTDLKEMENLVRSIEQDGLVWGAAKLVPVGYGINKLQIVSTIEDEKVSVDDIIEKIQDFEDFVQSVDIVAFNKV